MTTSIVADDAGEARPTPVLHRPSFLSEEYNTSGDFFDRIPNDGQHSRDNNKLSSPFVT